MSRDKIAQRIALLIWSISPLAMVAVLSFLVIRVNHGVQFFSIVSEIPSLVLIIFLFLLGTFLLDVPLWSLLLITYYIVRRKYKNKYAYYYVTILGNSITLSLGFLLLYNCYKDKYCVEGGEPLGSAAGWLWWIIGGHLLFTLPFMCLVNKLTTRKDKREVLST